MSNAPTSTCNDDLEVAYHDGLEVLPNRQTPKYPVLTEADRLGQDKNPFEGRLGNMKTSTFWIFLAIVAIITVGAAVGGAVGGTIAAREDFLGKPASNQPVVNSSNPQANQPSQTGSQTTPPAPPASPSSDCPRSNGTIYNSQYLNGANGDVPSTSGLQFVKVCGVEQFGFNLAQAYFLTFDACIELCASLNFWNKNKNCLGVAFKANNGMPGNCWAHNVTTSKVVDAFDTAILIV